MKTVLVSVIMLAVLAGCGSFGKRAGLDPAEGTATPVRDVKISTDFRDEGVKVVYTLTGAIDRIEVMGMAPAWRGNVDIVAEADAMDKLVKFVYGRSINSDRRNRIITHTLDRARDNTLNQFRTVDGTMNFDARKAAEELDREDTTAAPRTDSAREGKEASNTSRRIADRVEKGLVEATTTITASGRLVGVRKIRDRVVQDGRYYVAVYQWSPRDQDTAEFVRQRMR